MMSPENLSLAQAAAAIRSLELSPVEYVQALFEWIDRLESEIQAWAAIDRDAVLSEARSLETQARSKQFRGALHGVPVGVKDIFYTRGLRTGMGSVLFNDFVPDRDARVITKLKSAGAMVLGKTVTTVFANLDPGPTRNPWNVGHTPGGSSSGSAAGVAARMCAAALGTQTVGSVGRPAAYCGVASLVPAQARISLKGVFPLAWSLDHVGIFARGVSDLEMMFGVIADEPIEKPPAPSHFRIGVVRDFFYRHATADARIANDALADKLASSGFSVKEVKMPPIFDAHQPILRTILRTETASIHESLFAQHPHSYPPKLRALIETGMLVSGEDYTRARRLRRKYQREMAKLFENFDALLTPPACGPAPEGIASTGDPAMNGPWTLSDFPILTLPSTISSDGLPLGAQLTGPPGREGFLLQLGEAVEAVIGFTASPPMVTRGSPAGLRGHGPA
jgi:aspartyl-tRNA(Asn)/glutamyl-tRNA(Gln) amidotransferase subunit A